MATVNYELNAKMKKDGTYNVLIRVTHNRVLKRVATSIFVDRRDVKKNGQIKNYEVLEIIDDMLRVYRMRISRIAFDIDKYSIDDIVDAMLDRTGGKGLDFMKAYQEFISKSKSKGVKNYISAFHSFQKFVGKDYLDVREINYSFLSDYENFLGSGRKVSLYMSALKRVFLWARLNYNDEERNIIRVPYNPFEKYRVPRQNVATKRGLDVSVIRRIFNLPYIQEIKRDYINRRNFSKDIFILSFCLMGMNEADLYEASDFDGNRITYQRAKTRDRRADNAEIGVDVPNEVRFIFDKYRDKDKKRVFCFYKLYKKEKDFVRAVNLGLKQIASEIGLPTLQFYAARHSWATIARNDLKIDKGTVGEALNHVDSRDKVTDLYIRKDFKIINEVNKKVVEYSLKQDNQNIV